MNLQVGHTLRPINHNNTQHFKGNQRAEQHHLLYKTIKYFNCYNSISAKEMLVVTLRYLASGECMFAYLNTTTIAKTVLTFTCCH